MAAAQKGHGATDPAAEIGRYIAGALTKGLPGEVADKTKCHLLDTLAAIVSGSQLEPGRLGAQLAAGFGGSDEATVAGTRIVTSAVHAALANGMSGHADETDDSHTEGRFHPGCGIVPAALAMAERNGCSGLELLSAVALGYDIGARFNLALGIPSPKAARISTHSFGTAFGAAAAAGAIARLTAEQARHLLSYAVQQASGLPYWHRDPDHIEKAFDFGGMGARNGVYAALMVEAGCTGVADPLTGDHAFIEAFAIEPKPEALTSELGTRYEIMRASIKKWCTGSPIQAALDSLTGLMADEGVKAGDVEELIAHMPDDRLHIVSNAAVPDICLQHLLAITLIDGGLTFASSHEVERMRDPDVLAMRERIRAVPSAELTVARPARQAIVEIVTKEGKKLRRHTRAVRGTPDNPMPAAEVEAKALELVMPVLGEKKARALAEFAWGIEKEATVNGLRALLQP